LLLAVAALLGTIAIVAAGSGAAPSRHEHKPLASRAALAVFPLLKRTTPPASPMPCSVASGACVEGCALPIASTATPAATAPKLCRTGPAHPCVEPIVAAPPSPRAPFCAERPFPHQIFRAIPRSRHRRR
jgi:hypothetical protein